MKTIEDEVRECEASWEYIDLEKLSNPKNK